MPTTDTAPSTASATSISLGQIEVRRSSALFMCPGLGSCLGIVALDRAASVSGAAIIMLPQSAGSSDHPGRYANLAVKDLVEQMVAEGAQIERIQLAIAGGARVFRGTGQAGEALDIGGRNTLAVLSAIGSLELNCVAQDTGGELARTLAMDSSTGRVTVKSTCGGEKLLCNLGE